MKSTLEKEIPQTAERTQPVQYIAPDVNIFETPDGYALEAELPGVSKDGLEITLENNEVTIVGHRAPETAAGEPLLRERSFTAFRRVFELDPAIDTARIAAKINQGVLTLTLPKSEAIKPRKITVGD